MELVKVLVAVGCPCITVIVCWTVYWTVKYAENKEEP